jgi:hypothetical protein
MSYRERLISTCFEPAFVLLEKVARDYPARGKIIVQSNETGSPV